MLRSFLKELSLPQQIAFVASKSVVKTARSAFKTTELEDRYKEFALTVLNGYSVERKAKGVLLQKEKIQLQLRDGTSDASVFKQIFLDQDYQTLISIAQNNAISVETIIDLGANVGMTSIYLKSYFPAATVIAIEPDKGNFDQMVANFTLSRLLNANPLNVGIWSEDTYLKPADSFRDGQEWSKAFIAANEPTSIKAISVQSICEQFSLNQISILKIDIEGAEQLLFNTSRADVSFLDKTKIIAIEIHDEFGCRNMIYELLKQHNFIIWTSGELTIGVNKRLL